MIFMTAVRTIRQLGGNELGVKSFFLLRRNPSLNVSLLCSNGFYWNEKNSPQHRYSIHLFPSTVGVLLHASKSKSFISLCALKYPYLLYSSVSNNNNRKPSLTDFKHLAKSSDDDSMSFFSPFN